MHVAQLLLNLNRTVDPNACILLKSKCSDTCAAIDTDLCQVCGMHYWTALDEAVLKTGIRTHILDMPSKMQDKAYEQL